jgi:hypothetical protein
MRKHGKIMMKDPEKSRESMEICENSWEIMKNRKFPCFPVILQDLSS